MTSKLLTCFKTLRFYSGSFSALCFLIPWGYILRTLLSSPYAAPNSDSLDPGWTGCYYTLGLQKTPGHFLPACYFPNSADPLWTLQVIVKRFLSFFFFFLDAQLLLIFTIFWLSNSSFWLKMKKATIKMPWTTRAKYLLLWLNTSQTTLQIANVLKTAVMCSWWAMELHLWGSPWLSSTRCLEKHLNQLPTSELLNIKTKVLTEKSISGTAKSRSLVCTNYNLIYNFITDTYLSLRDQTAGSLLGTRLVSKINDSEGVTNGPQPK